MPFCILPHSQSAFYFIIFGQFAFSTCNESDYTPTVKQTIIRSRQSSGETERWQKTISCASAVSLFAVRPSPFRFWFAVFLQSCLGQIYDIYWNRFLFSLFFYRKSKKLSSAPPFLFWLVVCDFVYIVKSFHPKIQLQLVSHSGNSRGPLPKREVIQKRPKMKTIKWQINYKKSPQMREPVALGTQKARRGQ